MVKAPDEPTLADSDARGGRVKARSSCQGGDVGGDAGRERDMAHKLLARWHMLTATTAGSEEGVSIVEYALLGILIAVVAAIAVQLLGTSASDSFERYTTEINNT